MSDLNLSTPFTRPYGRRVLICVRGNCAHPDFGQRLYQRLTRLIQAHGLDDADHPHHVTCTVTYCLGVCAGGPIMIVHPGGIRYHLVDDATLDRIFQEHLLQDRPVEEKILKPKR